MSDHKRRPTSRPRHTPWAEDVFLDAALPEVLDRVAHTGVRSFDAELCTILLIDGGRLSLAAAAGTHGPKNGTPTIRVGQSVSGRTAAEGQPQRYADATSADLPGHAELEPRLRGALISAPITFQGELLGVINLCRPSGDPPFEGEDLKRLVASSGAVGLAVAAQRVMAAQSRELADQDQHLRTLFDDAPNPIFVLDWRGRFLEANAAAAAFLERTSEALTGLSLRDICPTEQVGALWQGLVMNKDQAPQEVTLQSGGKNKTLLLNLVPVNAGSAMVYYAIGHDYTPLKAAEQELRRSEERYRSLVSTMPALLVEIELDGTTNYVNPAIEAITGYTPDEITDKGWWTLLIPEDHEGQVEQLFDKLAAEGEVSEYVMRLTAKDGQQRTVLWSWSNRRRADGTLAQLEGFGLDISDRHLAEQQKDQLQQQLYLSRRLESVGRLAGGIAHDFNNLLTAITNYATLVADELGSGTQAHADVLEIRSAGDRAARLVKQLLAYSRKEVVRPRYVSLNLIVTELVKMLERLLGEHIQLEVQLAKNLPAIHIDPGQLEQIIVNLAVNAAHAMPRGGTLRLHTDVVEMDPERARKYVSVHSGQHVRLQLRDSGAGMPEDVLPKIFEPFFTTKARGEGTGLGLATVYGIVKQANGAIFVESTVDVGTEFEVLFPAKARRPDKRESSGLTRAELRGQERVLLVEDSEGVRNIASRILKRQGYSVFEAASGDEALRRVLEEGLKPDLLLTDVIMPGLSGRELVARLHEASPGLRVLYMSGFPDALVSAQGVLVDDVHFVAKPFTAQELLTSVREAIDFPGSTVTQ